jgi:hypothetical protein
VHTLTVPGKRSIIFKKAYMPPVKPIVKTMTSVRPRMNKKGFEVNFAAAFNLRISGVAVLA